MKKILFPLLTLSAVAFFACNKDDSPEKKFSTTDVQRISDSLKLVNQTSVSKDSMPVPKGTALKLETPEGPVYAVAGRFAVIFPSLSAGVAAGYHVQVQGAVGYYTITYPDAAPRQSAPHASHKHSALARLQETATPDNISISFRIPASLQAGTFTVLFEAYDKSGNVSNRVSTQVNVVTNDVKNASFKTLLGKWNDALEAEITNGDTTDLWYPSLADSTFMDLSCDNNQLNWSPGDRHLLINKYTPIENSISFNADGSGMERYIGDWVNLNVTNSHCDSLAYDNGHDDDTYPFGFYYDAAHKKLLIIDSDMGTDPNNYDATFTDVIELSARKLVVSTDYTDYKYVTVLTK